ncbi:MAG: hypothetical protein U0354_00695 [Candidatus Sericytochromatia bacterium]
MSELIAKDLLSKASSLVVKAIDLKDISLLNQAIDLYYESIENYSDLSEPYIALSYISFEMGNIELSEKFIHTALNIEPFNKKAQNILQKIKAFKDKPSRPLETKKEIIEVIDKKSFMDSIQKMNKENFTIQDLPNRTKVTIQAKETFINSIKK